MTTLKRVDVHVEGIVQGVGFRPFVYTLANRLGLAGHVRNDVNGVHIQIEGALDGVEEFLTALERDAPALSEIERVTIVSAAPAGHSGFTIAASDPAGPRRALVSADTATCDDCLRELYDPADRRHRYPFINCTNCGPRFTIVRGVPYDRLLTTMAGYGMCAACAREYDDPGDRRYHAQATCCPDCGPRLRLRDARGTELCGDPIACAATLLRAGRVLAVKGLGGFHLAVAASNERAAAALRGRKHREEKPFAVMVADLAQARRLCEVDEHAAALLTGRARPIVLLPRLAESPAAVPAAVPAAAPAVAPAVAPSVAPGNRSLGLMLPYTPLHHLLLAELGQPMVLTSGNVSDEPIAYEDADALTRLSGVADAFLIHDRGIHTRTDDSVVRTMAGQATLLRRARGYAPEPLALRAPAPRPVLACGAELKSTFCLAHGHRAFVSQHIGDLENYETLRSFVEGVDHYCGLFGLSPEVVAHDLHPEYLSTKHALELPGVELVGVQHHHAHIASCLADNGDPGPVIGVAFDGLGHGADGTLWGGEFLRADLVSFERLGHLAQIPMPGGTAAIRQPWRMAAAYLGDDHPGLEVVKRNADRWADVLGLAAGGLDSPLTSSAGRLFDAVSALLGVRDKITYDGQAAIELEQHADPSEPGAYRATITTRGPLVVEGGDLVRAAADDLAAGVDGRLIAGRFHHGVADAITRSCVILRQSTGLTAVALSGGVFQNLLLLERTVGRLRTAGFRVLRHQRVPPNDGGVSLGQAAVAAARDRS
ncbi:hydrogenase maturation protein HypF [Nonomuraea solani]|uniref:Carbamoyltransferase n=1 Tax=Nonomuraea solani TaxID=1144553 RepID=A0A1H6EXX4_9ACTN|nr:carbamoyltransferase HypF [Nonomuraea solani]SEH01931.1 hydrogenase maturation protein HypF [Nonomuraea solani]